jgi:hypothetical protein
MEKIKSPEVRHSSKTVCQVSFPFHPDRQLTARFDGGKLSSDAGLLCLYALDQQHRLTAGFAGCLKDARDSRYVRHQIRELLTQRSFQIVAGYEDCNDADSLRSDPIFKTVCDRLPESDPDLASQPTLSRLENSVDSKDLTRLGRWLLETYLKHRKKSRPEKIILDMDSTDDVTHGQQEFSFYHGYYREHMYHPLLLFDGETGDLVCALLRPGNQGAASHAVAVLKRVVARMRQVLGSDVQIEVRADSGFATPALYEFCEEEKLQYGVGFARNPRLEGALEPLVAQVQRDYQHSGEKQRQFTELVYQADSWDRKRRIVAKVEVSDRGLNRRFVVTNRQDLMAGEIYDHYIGRGQCENFVKAFKKDLAMDRLSCHRFLANQFRLFVHALAYVLILRLRDYLYGTHWHNLEIETLRRRLFKIGARVRETSRRIWVHLASSYPEQKLFALLMHRLCPT